MRRRTQQGGVLVLTILVLTLVTATLALGIARAQTDTKTYVLKADRERAKLAAHNGIQYALAILQNQETGPVNQTQEWYTTGQNGDELTTVGGSSFRLQVIDAASLINANTAPEALIDSLGVTTEQRDSLLDWREDTPTPRTEGAKDDYYNTLTTPYNAKLRRLSSPDELLLIKGWDAQTLYQLPTEQSTGTTTEVPLYGLLTVDSFSSNNNAQGEAKTNLNTAQLQQLVQAGIPANVANAIITARTQAGGQLTSWLPVFSANGMTTEAATALLDGFQIGGAPRNEGKINLNTASEQVLSLLPGVTPDIASAIVSRQSSGFATLGEVLQVPGMSLQILAQTADLWTITSEIFIARVEGQFGNVRVAQEAVISLNGGRARIEKIYDSPYTDMTTLWNWNEETTTENSLGATE